MQLDVCLIITMPWRSSYDNEDDDGYKGNSVSCANFSKSKPRASGLAEYNCSAATIRYDMCVYASQNWRLAG